MKYQIQSKWNGDQEWRTLNSSRAGHQEFENLEEAINVFTKNTNMARIASVYQRIIDSEGKIVKYYDPEIWMKGLGDGIS